MENRPVQTTVNYTKPDGAAIWTRLTLSPIELAGDRRSERYILMAEDITLAHEQQLRLGELVAQLGLATEAAEIGIWYWNFADNSVQWDARMFEMFGRTADLRAGVPASYDYWVQSLHPDDAEATVQSLSAAVDAGENWGRTYRILCPDGEVRSIESSCVVRRDGGDRSFGVLGICRNITSQLKLQSDLVAALFQAMASRD